MELLDSPIVTFLADPTTPEREWPKIQRWLDEDILGKNICVMSYFLTPFERRVLQLLVEHKHPAIFYTSRPLFKLLPAECKISRKTPQFLAIFQYTEYNPTYPPTPSELAIMNIADSVVSIGAQPNGKIYELAYFFRKQSQKLYREL